MVNNPVVVNPNDYKVVSFHNKESFTFTSEMGCMFNSVPINGASGAPGINPGETLTLPYHIAHRLAENLAKVALVRSAPPVDQAGVPIGVPLWDVARLNNIKASYLTELYTESRPAAMTDTEKLLAKVEEYKKMADTLSIKMDKIAGVQQASVPTTEIPSTFQDKAEVIAELNKRGIKFDARSNKDTLMKLLA